MFTRAFKLSLKDCADPFTDAEKEVTIPVIGEVAQMACGRTPSVAELATNFKVGMPNLFGDATEEQIALELDGMVLPLLWGQSNQVKVFLPMGRKPTGLKNSSVLCFELSHSVIMIHS